ncbi:hypothetical protein [Flavihumibacter solisilvae]|uniref:Uncharacterized protein n=1 Tax=Flavihumibacter solisilvae TaxID=1349421 RepID=A0A0C1L7H4_9BACT|nr:hypothetical protein [Flavihumibacter solisilvae]KIC95471.1 hypothetical protein OI18_06200 [Flavihumibacter solisilvae]
MEQQLLKMQKDLVRLKWYAGTLTLLFAVVAFLAFSNGNASQFKEISAERINIIEKNGQLRMAISNKERSPEVMAYGKPLTPPIPGGNRPGLIFFNDEGTENGGLVFMGGKDSSGKYTATGHLSFDQYNQNQVLYLTYSDENGDQYTGLHVDDWQTSPAFWDWRAEYKKTQKLPDGAEKEALLKNLMEPKAGVKAVAQRVFVGKDDSKTAMVTLSDRMGKPRLQMLVDSNGTAKLNFLDEQGKVTYSLPK